MMMSEGYLMYCWLSISFFLVCCTVYGIEHPIPGSLFITYVCASVNLNKGLVRKCNYVNIFESYVAQNQ